MPSVGMVMHARFQTQRNRLGIGMALAILIGASFAPGVARAGCGEGPMLPEPGRAAHPVHPAPVVPDQPPLPCSGPHCSHGPVTPPSAPVTVPDPESKWLATTELLAPLSLGLGVAWLAEVVGRAIHQPSAIFHPPRARNS